MRNVSVAVLLIFWLCAGASLIFSQTMSDASAEKLRIEALRREIAEHDERYYRHAAPIISDYEYDQLKSELKKLRCL